MLREWLAAKLAPQMALDQKRYRRMKLDISHDRWWLAAEFPAVFAFATRALDHDDWFWSKDVAPHSEWRYDISEFRNQLRRLYGENQ